MINKHQRVLLSTIVVLGLLLLSGVCAIKVPEAKALPNATSITDAKTLPVNNSTFANTNLSPTIGGSVTQYSINSTFSPPSANIPLTQPPTMTPLIKPGDSSVVYGPMTGQTQWWSIDFWCTTSGGQKPSFMDGQFVAVKNTISGMNSGDWVAYEPMNVAYGTSNNNFVWYQFVVYLYANTLNPEWAVWQFPNGDGTQGTYSMISLPYIAGDTYNFGYTTSGTNTVTFSIFDTNNPQNPYTKTYSAPGIQLLYNQGAYSPASCVEGDTSTSQLTNVPYFQTYTGYGETTHYHSNSAGVPSGIGTGIWSAGTNYYYWSMLGQNSVSNIISASNIGAGSVSNANNVIGAQNGQYADFWGPNYGDGGSINAQMNALSGGNIYVYGYSTSGYYSELWVYVSMDDNTWTQLQPIVISSTTPNWINVGSYMGDFKYLALTGYDAGCSVNLHLDAVKVGT